MKLFRTIAIAVCATVAGALPLIAQAQGKIEKPKVSIAVGGKAGFYYLPLTIAERLGYFKDEGLDVEISDFAGGSKALQAVVGGSADVVSGAWENTIDQQPKGLNMQGFVLMGRYPAISLGIVKSKAAAYKSPKDLKGMKIGVSAPGSSTNRLVLHMLAKDGLKGDDVSIIGVGTASGAIAAVEVGQHRRDLERRSSDHDARIQGRHRPHRRHAHRQGNGGRVRQRRHAGRGAVRADRLRQEESEHRAGADQRDRARAAVARQGDARPGCRDRARPNICWATRPGIWRATTR